MVAERNERPQSPELMASLDLKLLSFLWREQRHQHLGMHMDSLMLVLQPKDMLQGRSADAVKAFCSRLGRGPSG